MIIVDGKKYEEGTQPDLGSIVCTNNQGMLREYTGLAADVSKLPKYDDLLTGSSFFAIDTGAAYMYEATTKTWYAL